MLRRAIYIGLTTGFGLMAMAVTVEAPSGGSGSLVGLATCDAASCKPRRNWICNIGGGDNKEYCDVEHCDLI